MKKQMAAVLSCAVGALGFVATTQCGRSHAPAVTEVGPQAGAPAVTPKTPMPASGFQVEWQGAGLPAEMRAGSVNAMQVTFKNVGNVTWPDTKAADPGGTGAFSVRLSYRWWNAGQDQQPLPNGYVVRVPLPHSVSPGETVTLPISVTAPAQPGAYRLQFDLVQELVAWFADRGAAPLLYPVTVR